MGEDGGTGDTGDHSPDETQGGMPRSRSFDGAFFTVAIVVAIALLVVILFLKG